MTEWKVIGISGVTCAGKSTLSDKLLKVFKNSVLLSQDQFFRSEEDPNHEWVDISPGVKHQNWESMVSIDWQAFTKAIHDVMARQPPSQSPLLIIEGHLIFNYKPISDICQKKVFLTLSKEECFARRDVRTYIPSDPEGYFDAWVWPMYLTNLEHMKALQTGVQIEFIDGSVDENIISNDIIKHLKQFMN